MKDWIRVEKQEHTLVIELNRPKVNAISPLMSRMIHAAVQQGEADNDVRCMVITSSNPKVFCAGWDLNALADGDYSPEKHFDPVEGHGPGGFAGICETFSITKPIVSVVRGAAIGGGFEIALASDVIVAGQSAYFQLPELMRGFLPDAGGVQRLPKLISPMIARDLLYTGRRFEADEAKQYGLVARVVEDDKALESAFEIAALIGEAAPLAVQACKAVLRQNEDASLEDAMRLTHPSENKLEIVERMRKSDDFFEGSRAFIEKRKPRWTGR